LLHSSRTAIGLLHSSRTAFLVDPHPPNFPATPAPPRSIALPTADTSHDTSLAAFAAGTILIATGAVLFGVDAHFAYSKPPRSPKP
jgi:hypothetical protein